MHLKVRKKVKTVAQFLADDLKLILRKKMAQFCKTYEKADILQPNPKTQIILHQFCLSRFKFENVEIVCKSGSTLPKFRETKR